MIQPNRVALKELAKLQIDARFAHEMGTRLFNFLGESSEEYLSVCEQFKELLGELHNEITDVLSALPQS